MDPTTTGIIIGAAVTIVVSIIAGRFGKPIASAVGATGIGNWFKVLYYFLPYSLFLFGVIYDGLMRKINFFPAGFFGLAAVMLNWAISRFWTGGPVIDGDTCGLPGLSRTGSNLAPQNIVFASTVMSYIATYISVTQSDAGYSSAAWGGFGFVFIAQVVAYYMNKCYDSKISTGPPVVNNWIVPGGSFGPPLAGVLLGLAIGSLTGGLIGGLGKGNVGDGISSDTKQSLTSGGPVTAPASSGGGKCSPTDSDDQFVCEAYKNGELVTSTIVE